MTCPPADRLVQFGGSGLDTAERHAMEVHLDRCAECRTTVSELARGAVDPARFGRYRIDGELGQGGMGIVFRAWDPQLSRAVAIKVVRHGDEQHRARLVREAQSLARLSHPHVCQVYDVGNEGDEVWFAMELIEGTTLRAWATEHTADEVRAVLLDVAEGLAAAHAADLVHRDVKPDNVLVDRRGRAVVTDFGLARIVATHAGPALTSTGVVFGSPGYMAPEQLSGSRVDARADQFSWAVTAWELLATSRPLPLEPTARLVALVSGVTAPPELPGPFGQALVRALAVEPAERFASMDELLRALHVEAATPAPRRRPRTAVVVAGVGLAAMAAVAIVMWRGASSASAPVSVPLAAPAPAPVAAPAPAPAAEALPAGYRRAQPIGAAAKVDPMAEWSRTYEEARAQYSDVRVDSLSVQGLREDGTVDLAVGTVQSAFFSPSAHRRAAPHAGLTAALQATGGYVMASTFPGELARLLPWPRCTVRDIWQRAAAKRGLPAGGVASITYVSDPRQVPTWYFKMGPIEVRLRDDCEPGRAVTK